MNLKKKVILIFFLFTAFFFLTNLKSQAAFVSASTLDLERLSYDFTKSIAEASDKSKMPASPDSYNNFLMVQCSNSIYYLVYSTGELGFQINYDSTYNCNTFNIINPNGYSFFRVIYNYSKSTFEYRVSIDTSTSYTLTDRLNKESITGYYCTYPVYEYSNSTTQTGFFLAKSEIIPLHTALVQVESQLYPETILGTVKILIPACLVILSTLLAIWLLRSRIWLPI